MSAGACLAEIVRWFGALLLLSAAWGKWRTLAEFRHNLGASFGFAPGTATVLAPLVVVTELLLGALIAFDHGLALTAMAAAWLLLAALTLLVGYKFLRQDVVRCSCFGEQGRPVSVYDLLRNLLVLAALGFAVGHGTTTPLPPTGLTAVTAFLLGLILNMLALRFHDIATVLTERLDGRP